MRGGRHRPERKRRGRKPRPRPAGRPRGPARIWPKPLARKPIPSTVRPNSAPALDAAGPEVQAPEVQAQVKAEMDAIRALGEEGVVAYSLVPAQLARPAGRRGDRPVHQRLKAVIRH